MRPAELALARIKPAQLGLWSFAVAIAIGVYVGLKLDEWFGTKPWFFFIFLFFGITAGFRNIYIIAGREIKREDNGKD